MTYDFNRIQDDLIINEIVKSLTSAICGKMEELHERDVSPFINGIDGLARYLNIGTTTAQEIKNNKEIPSFQRVRTVWFKKADADKFVEKNRN